MDLSSHLKSKVIMKKFLPLIVLILAGSAYSGPFQSCRTRIVETMPTRCTAAVCDNGRCVRFRYPDAYCVVDPFDTCNITEGPVLGERQRLPCHYAMGDCWCNAWGDNPIEVTYVYQDSGG